MLYPFQLPLLLDGATGTNLIAAGLPQGACVEAWILEHPEPLISLQRAFAAAGSDAVYAPTFSANRAKLDHFGLAEKVTEMNTRLVSLSREAAPGKLIGGDLSPTGLFVEPFGDTTFSELKDIYYEQGLALKAAGVDFIIAETMMSLAEARAAVIATRKLGLPIFVTMTVDEKGRTLTGASALSCLVCLQELGVSAFGLNCSYGPEKMAELIAEIAPFAKVPLIAKPNAGQPHADRPDEYDLTPDQTADAMRLCLDAGAQIIGGCCGSTPAHIAEMRRLLDRYDFQSVSVLPDAHDLVLANEQQVFLLDEDRIETTEPIACTVDMADDLLDAEEDSFDVLLIEVHTPDDAYQFNQNARMARLPVMFYSDDELALKTALLLYNGRALVDSKSSLPDEVLEEIAFKYGAVVY